MAILPIEVKTTGISQVDKLDRSLSNLEKQSKKTATATKTLSNGFKAITSAGIAYIAVDRLASSVISLSQSFIATADSMSLITSRLSLVTSGTQELISVQAQLLSISNEARVSLSSTSDLYSQMARSTQALGLSSEYLLDVTDTISKTLTISGASAQSASAALFQLSQGFSAGALRGEELNSVLEQTPRLAQAIADGMGVSIGQLRKLGSEGALTAEKVLESLKTQASAVNAEFAGIATTAESGYKVLGNNIDTVVGKTDKFFKVTENIGNVFIALSKTSELVFNDIIKGYGNSAEASIVFANFAIESVNGIIEAFGLLYDVVNSIGLAIDVVQTGIFALLTPIQSMANVLNSFLNGILAAADAIGKFAGFGGIDFRLKTTKFAEEGVKRNFNEAKENFNQIGQGGDLAEKITTKASEEFSKLLLNLNNGGGSNANTPSSPTIIDLTTKKAKDEIENPFNDVAKALKDNGDSINDILKASEDLNDTLANDSDSLNDSLEDTNDTFSTFTDSANNVDFAVSNATEALDNFIFQFENTFINSIRNNMSSLESIANSTAITSTSYTDALRQAQQARNDLIANPLDVGIGQVYTDAFNQFVNSSANYLTAGNFGSSAEFAFAQSTVGSQTAQFQDTAGNAVSVLDSMNNFLESINQAFADGILSDEEKATIAGVATDVNNKNTQLLGFGQSNSVSTLIDTLSGGTDIQSLKNATDVVATNSGLTRNEVSNVYSATQGTTTAVNSQVGTSNANLSSINSKVGKIRSSSTTTKDFLYRTGDGENVYTYDTETTNYTYFAKGGFTGSGMGQKDSTGFKQAGVVHEDEWVAPKWMVDSNQGLFNQLEGARQSRGFADGGYTSANNNVSISNNDMNMEMLQRLDTLSTLFTRLTEGGDALKVELTA